MRWDYRNYCSYVVEMSEESVATKMTVQECALHEIHSYYRINVVKKAPAVSKKSYDHCKQ